jgi:tripartite-type tricarboxylate transporter receptor subunit TctC
VALAVGVAIGLVQAQPYPSKPVKIVVPFPAGGSVDTLARVVGQYLSKKWSQSVLVENKPGGGTVIAGAMVAKAPADGYTLIVIANSLVINAKLNPNLPYDGLKAFDPIALLTYSPQVFAVSSQSNFMSFKDFVDAAKAQPGVLSYSTVGPSSTQHIAGELLKRVVGIELTYVPFTGGLLAANAVMGGHVSAVLTNLSEVNAMIEAQKLRALAVTTLGRLDALKAIPSVHELGYKDYEAAAWFGVATPANTPKDVTAKLSDDFAMALKDPETQQKLLLAGLYPSYLSSKDFAAYIKSQYEKYSKIIDEAQIKAQ